MGTVLFGSGSGSRNWIEWDSWESDGGCPFIPFMGVRDQKWNQNVQAVMREAQSLKQSFSSGVCHRCLFDPKLNVGVTY